MEFYKTILDNLAADVLVINADGHIVYVNEALLRKSKYSSDQYLSMNIHDVCKTNQSKADIFDLVCQKKQTVAKHQTPASPGKSENAKIITGSPVFDENKKLNYVIVTVQDAFNQAEKPCKAPDSNDTDGKKVYFEKRNIIFASTRMQSILDMASVVAKLDTTILISGESGTGKENLVRYICENSSRSDRQIITVNCASFPEGLLESELFGYEKGSFTGALNSGKQGMVEAADGGILYLDEINSLPLYLQGKLLRVIDEKRVKRIGAIKSKKVDFRLIAATNADLYGLVKKGEFRPDLYYRLNVVPFKIPPLRERREDIAPIANYYAEYFSYYYNMQKQLSESVLDSFGGYDWPGNVRELKNFVEWLIVTTPPDAAVIDELPEEMLQKMTKAETIEYSGTESGGRRKRLDKETVLKALEKFGGHREKTAEFLGISKRTLQYKIKEYDLKNTGR